MSTDEYTSVTEAIAGLARRGFTVGFEMGNGGLRATDSGRLFRPEELTVRAHYRFEGVSDPDDMAVVYALEADDGTRGFLVDAFGVYASPSLGSLLERMHTIRDS